MNDFEEMTKKVRAMIKHMKTDEYWIKHGGNGPWFDEGGELMTNYLEEVDKREIPRLDCLVVPFNQVLNANLAKPYIQNRTTTDEVKIIMMSGKTFTIPVDLAKELKDLMEEVYRYMYRNLGIRPSKMKGGMLLDGDRALDQMDSRLIITDETELTLVLIKK